jgi:probable rRNA maturation factor
MIEVNNFTKAFLDKALLRKIGQRVLEKEGIKDECEISVALVEKREIRQLNKIYRGKDESTDVLSFSDDPKFISPPFQIRYLGEIIICPSQIRQRVRKNSKGIQKELMRVFVHGLLHLLGYVHKSEKEAKIMETKEDNYLSLFFKN